jgi:hypothetical protein
MIGPDNLNHQHLKNSHNIGPKQKTSHIRLATCEIGQILGFYDYGSLYSTSLKCVTTEGQLYYIKSEEFMQKIKRDERVFKQLVDMTLEN